MVSAFTKPPQEGQSRSYARAELVRLEPRMVTSEPEHHERRIMELALKHWEQQRLAVGGCCPPLDAIQLNHPVLKPYFYVVKIPPDVAHAEILHCGGSLSTLCGHPAVGQRVLACWPREINAQRLDTLSAVSQMSRPMAESGTFDHPLGGSATFREALMPLKSIGPIRLVLGAISFHLTPFATA